MPKTAVTVALIVAAALIAAVSLYLYFSPYQQCLRAKASLSLTWKVEPTPEIDAITCAHATPG